MPPVDITFRRHAKKTLNEKHITSEGWMDAFNASKDNYNPTKYYWSGANRTKETAEAMNKGMPIINKYEIRERKTLRGHKYFSKEKTKERKVDNVLRRLKEVAKRFGFSDRLLINVWLKGKFPSFIVPKPDILADNIIKDRFALPERINKKIEHTIVFENLTHDVVIAALFQRLSGERYYSQFAELPKELEALKIEISKDGKATMYFRSYRKEITEKLNNILTN